MNTPDPGPRDPDAAEPLFGDPLPPPPTAAAAAPGDEYALDDIPDDAPRRAAPTFPADEPVPKKARGASPGKAARPEAAPPAKAGRVDTSATVDEVWTRGAEWGGTLVKLCVAALVLLCLVYVFLSSEHFGWAFLTMIASVPALVFVAYPVLITLERPVRMTPEQAVNDFFSAASHHGPHYRRMWLLLSTPGRVCGSYASFEGFRSYWKTRLAVLRSGHAGGFTPLKFQINDFRSEKSGGLSHIEATYTVNVFVRGDQAGGPIHSARVTTTLVKGPDRMWYLNTGTLP